MTAAAIPSTAAPSATASEASWVWSLGPFVVMCVGMFMALLDIQIIAASLNDVQAGLAAGPDEISWVQTAYLMAELVMIPFSAFLAQALSTRWLFALSAALLPCRACAAASRGTSSR